MSTRRDAIHQIDRHASEASLRLNRSARLKQFGERGLQGLLIFLATAVLSCAASPRWYANDRPSEDDVTVLLETRGAGTLFRDMHASEIPRIPVRQRFRPCCAFGADLGVSLWIFPVPGYRIGNVLDPEELGLHSYDSGVVRLGYDSENGGLLHREKNGLLYTCRGGFVDTAHVRDNVDWAIYLATMIARNLEKGIVIELPDEGGKRRVVLRPVPSDVVARIGRRRITLPLAQWAAFQISLWHEIATWYGWSSVPGFPEVVSAFSPEDLYSNILGQRIALGIAAQRAARSESVYNRSVDEWLAKVLKSLGVVSKKVSLEAIRALDGVWWDSRARLPQAELVLRRNLDVGEQLSPWLVPTELMPASLREACEEMPEPLPLANPSNVDGMACGDLIHLDIEVDDRLLGRSPFDRLGLNITQNDFPEIIEVIRAETRVRFGPSADRPGS